MNLPEFVDSLKLLRITFERVDAFLQKADAAGNYGPVTHVWFEMLKPCRKDAVDDAIKALAVEEQQPRSADGYPRRIRSMALQAKGDVSQVPVQYAGDQQVFRCKTCRDTGWVIVRVFGNELQKCIQIYGEGKAYTITTAVVCRDCRINTDTEHMYFIPDLMFRADTFYPPSAELLNKPRRVKCRGCASAPDQMSIFPINNGKEQLIAIGSQCAVCKGYEGYNPVYGWIRVRSIDELKTLNRYPDVPLCELPAPPVEEEIPF